MSRKTNRQHLESLVPAESARKWPRPERKRVFILFTPRSGSSWFGDLLRSTRAFGNPEEFLNQDTNVEVVQRFAARTEHDFLHALETVTASGKGVFSIEVVWGHLELSEIDLMGYYAGAGAHFLYLRRRDILAQAISLALATSTGVFHNPQGQAAGAQQEVAKQLISPETTFAAIRQWWGHLMNYECLTEVQFLLRGITPLRIYYEDIVVDPAKQVSRAREFCGIPNTVGGPPSSSYKPVSSTLNAELAQLFLNENRAFADAMNAFRPPLL